MASIFNFANTNKEDGVYLTKFFNDKGNVLLEEKSIEFSGGVASTILDIASGSDVHSLDKGDNPPVTGMCYVGTTTAITDPNFDIYRSGSEANTYDAVNYFWKSNGVDTWVQHLGIDVDQNSTVNYSVLLETTELNDNHRLFDNTAGDTYLEFSITGSIKIVGNFTAILNGVDIVSGVTPLPDAGDVAQIIITPTSAFTINYTSSPLKPFRGFIFNMSASGVLNTSSYISGTVSIPMNVAFGSNVFADEDNASADVSAVVRSGGAWVDNGDDTWTKASYFSKLIITSGIYDAVRIRYHTTDDTYLRVTDSEGVTINEIQGLIGDVDVNIFDLNGDIYISSASTVTLLSNPSAEVSTSASIIGYKASDVFLGLSSININVNTVSLLESVSVYVTAILEGDVGFIRYKDSTSSVWLEGFPLTYEPMYGTLNGVVTYLSEGTDYDLEVTIRRGDTYFVHERVITTRAIPTIDVAKTYNLSDIYTEGAILDIPALITAGTIVEGNADGWMKIIGDVGTVVTTTDQTSDGAIHIGKTPYIFFEDIGISGGYKHGVDSLDSHHLWFKNMDISGWGRTITTVTDGKGYDINGELINYDAAFGLVGTGVVVVENSTAYAPVPKANSWAVGHPAGPCAYLVSAKNSNDEFSGQVIIRNNDFQGTDTHRLNDVIESYTNGSIEGGFIRDSAIYGNTLAYSNDDTIEMDGGQQNVMFYDNDVSHSYGGISIIPNMIGPCYVFNNYVHDNGDEDGNSFFGIKAGGLLSKFGGITYVFNNLFKLSCNGIASANYGDRNFWIDARNNIILSNGDADTKAINDTERYFGSKFINNYTYNLVADGVVLDAKITEQYNDSSMVNLGVATTIWDDLGTAYVLSTPEKYIVPNLSRVSNTTDLTVGLV
jgi:hypothetical protein